LDLRAVREVNTGFGDGLASAFEMVATPAIMGFLGFLVDRWAGTNLVFMLSFGLFTFGYMLWKLIMRYNAQMAEHEAKAPWNRPSRPAAPPRDAEGTAP
jgi:F0F1-type ATP synthase assembly protein I